ncbi:MAG: hypothetical protein IKF36_06245 [Bacilli bacterium]|nr:hypothetical protein [Bacilli bacterium]
MKKISLLLVIALVLFIPIFTTVRAVEKQKVTVYLFRGEGCPHCAEAEEFFEELKNDEEYGKYFVVKDYEVWYDEDNAALMQEVAEKLDTTASGVPFIVIGEKFHSGFSSKMVDTIKDEIKTYYESQEIVDVVNGNSVVEKEESNKIIPIVIVSVIAIGTVIGLVFLTREK